MHGKRGKVIKGALEMDMLAAYRIQFDMQMWSLQHAFVLQQFMN
jgi:hypothetical protein